MSRRKQRSAFDQVSEFDRGRIVAYRDCGLSFRKIDSRVGRDHTTVMRICDRWMQEVPTWSIASTSVRHFTRPLLGLPLTQNHRRLRRQWCDERQMWAAERNEVVFTNESRICLQHHDGRIRVWRHRGERILTSCVMHRHTGPAPDIMVWGGIEYHSRFSLVRIAGTLNSQRYISEMLEPAGLGPVKSRQDDLKYRKIREETNGMNFNNFFRTSDCIENDTTMEDDSFRQESPVNTSRETFFFPEFDLNKFSSLESFLECFDKQCLEYQKDEQWKKQNLSGMMMRILFITREIYPFFIS
ncbi:transposable element Tcb1 transposase [Trichonephila clavipes]|nr:transposable element Tcb1 transposase [Trichonephila clavipes]